jgi:fatty acid desaturase
MKPIHARDYLSSAEIEEALSRSNARAIAILLSNYAIIAAAFALSILWPNPLTFLATVVILGGRQLGLEVLNHDCAHAIFFRNRRVNEVVGHWLCGGPMNTSLFRYRDYHLEHHRHAGTPQDPDLSFISAYPTTRESLERKFMRDITGRTGFRDTMKQFRKMRLGRNAPFFVTHAVLIAGLTAAGAPWAYLLWWVAYIFVYPVVTRLRAIGEHGVAKDRLSPDARLNTSSTRVSLWERLLVAPNYVNYHLEHHLLAAVPLYRLRRFHERLREKGAYSGFDCVAAGYRDVLRRAVRPA